MNEGDVSAAGRVDELERTVRNGLRFFSFPRDEANAALSELAVIARDGQRAQQKLDGMDEWITRVSEHSTDAAEAADRYRQAFEVAAYLILSLERVRQEVPVRDLDEAWVRYERARAALSLPSGPAEEE